LTPSSFGFEAFAALLPLSGGLQAGLINSAPMIITRIARRALSIDER
jgi:hypothetical protein